MKYLWIIMIAIPFLIWCIASIVDIITTFKDYGPFHFYFSLEFYSKVWLLLAIFTLCIYSFSLWIAAQ